MEREKIEVAQIETVEQAVRYFLDTDDVQSVIGFLRDHKDEVSEFCMQIQDIYNENDRRTPILQISRLLGALL